jgi:hypothetical protein
VKGRVEERRSTVESSKSKGRTGRDEPTLRANSSEAMARDAEMPTPEFFVNVASKGVTDVGRRVEDERGEVGCTCAPPPGIQRVVK